MTKEDEARAAFVKARADFYYRLGPTIRQWATRIGIAASVGDVNAKAVIRLHESLRKGWTYEDSWLLDAALTTWLNLNRVRR
jgi:hypothetical protein